MSFISKQVEKPEFESLSEEIMVRIPNDNFSNDSGRSLNNFFEELDENLENLKIKSYTVSMPTLEDVFLNIAVEDEADRISKLIKEEEKYDNVLFESDYLDDSNNGSKFCSHIKANVNRRLKLLYRDKKGFLLEILCPIILIIIGAFISKIDFFIHTKDFSTDDIRETGLQKIYYFKTQSDSFNYSEKYSFNDYSNIESELKDLSENKTNITENLKMFMNDNFNLMKDSESYEGHYVDMRKKNKNYYANFASYLFLKNNSNNPNYSEYTFIELINARMTQGVSVYTGKMLEKIFDIETKGELKIKFKNKIMPKTKLQKNQGNLDHALFVIFFLISFSLIPSNFIFIIVRERNNNSKHLMRLSGLNIMAYWIVNFLFELLKYYIVGGIVVGMVYIFGFQAPYLIPFYLLNGPTLIFFIYFMSFFFTDESTAQSIMLLINILFGVLFPPVIVFLRQQDSTIKVGKALQYAQSIFPSFSFACSYFLSYIKDIIYNVENKDKILAQELPPEIKNKELIKNFYLLLSPLIFLSGEFVLFFISLVLMEVFSYRNPGEKK
jgi:ATP-binding cassette subfamily A (ABC1) protein 3